MTAPTTESQRQEVLSLIDEIVSLIGEKGEALPSSCGLEAAATAWRCFNQQIPCEILSLKLGPDHPGNGTTHFLAVYWEPGGTPFVYDGHGSRALWRLGKHEMDAARIAEAWCPGSTKAVWLTGPVVAS